MNKSEVYKELLKSKVLAKFSHYISGSLYYTVRLSDGLYQFPIQTVNEVAVYIGSKKIHSVIDMSDDLGTTPFKNEIRASELNRWIAKAIDNGEFTKIKSETIHVNNGKTNIIVDDEIRSSQG